MFPIESGEFAWINGLTQWITIRGADSRNPVLLILGGPGAAFSALAPLFAPWEARFTLVQWDQPGAGATHGLHGAQRTGALSLERIAADGIAVTELALRRTGHSKLVVLGFSAGTIVGLMMVRSRPDLFSAYVGSGQVVDWARQDALSYELVIDRARRAQDAQALAELERIGPPPYADTPTDAIKSKHAGAMTAAERAAMARLAPAELAAFRAPPEDASYVAAGVPLEDPRARSMAVYDALRQEIVRFDARKLGLDFRVPMFFFQGEEDVFTVTSEVERYARDIDAPQKECVIVPGAGHATCFMRDEMLRLLDAHVRTLAIEAQR